MTNKLASREIFLDTCELVQRKFNYENKELASFRKLCQEEILRLVLTDVTARELEAKLREQLDEATAALKNVRKSGTVLQALDQDWLRELFKRPDKERLEAELKKQLYDFLEGTRCKTMITEDLSAGPILNRYFEGQPPFGSGKKKHEFPDAFALAALESRCESTGQAIYVVSDDEDLKQACEESSSLVYAEGLASILELALKDKGVLTDMAHSVFDRLRNDVEEEVRETWEDLDIMSLDEVGAEVSGVKVKAVDLGPEMVVQQVDGSADYLLHANISFEADAEYYEPGNFIWDSETKNAVYLEKVHRRIERSVEVPVEITIRFDAKNLRSSTNVVEQIVVNRNEHLILETEN